MSIAANKASSSVLAWTERGPVPDGVIRAGIRRLCCQRLNDIKASDVESAADHQQAEYIRRLVVERGLRNIEVLTVDMNAQKIFVNDRIQTGYEYFLTEPCGRHFPPEFKPELTPSQLLKMGVFGGKYMTDCRDEFPAEWFDEAKLSPTGADKSLNFFGVRASKPLSYWKEKGWIWPDDPRGWFQWYCRYYRGRRCDDDARQIRRWKAMTRHIAQVRKNCMKGDLLCRPRQRQALLHWAYDSRYI